MVRSTLLHISHLVGPSGKNAFNAQSRNSVENYSKFEIVTIMAGTLQILTWAFGWQWLISTARCSELQERRRVLDDFFMMRSTLPHISHQMGELSSPRSSIIRKSTF